MEFNRGMSTTDEIMLGRASWDRLFEAPSFFYRQVVVFFFFYFFFNFCIINTKLNNYSMLLDIVILLFYWLTHKRPMIIWNGAVWLNLKFVF